MELPETLRVAINEMAERYPHRALAQAAEALSETYRAERTAGTAQAMVSPVAAVAYAVTRLPATFAAVAAALLAARAREPEWSPRTCLDAGAGPGAAVWAASGVWPSLERATLLERDERMVAVGRELLEAAPAGPAVAWERADLLGAWGAQDTSGPFDLVTCAYALNEVPQERRAELTLRLWEATGGTLALVAPGTPAGFAAIRAARSVLLEAGAHMVAPCPHGRACPMPPGNWCHMAQRLARSRLHRQLKGGAAPFEDEKFSYVVVSRQAVTPAEARVIRHPQVRTGRISLELCGAEGLERREIMRRDREAFRAARDAYWGSSWPPDRGSARV